MPRPCFDSERKKERKKEKKKERKKEVNQLRERDRKGPVKDSVKNVTIKRRLFTD